MVGFRTFAADFDSLSIGGASRCQNSVPTCGRPMMAKGYWVAFADVHDPEGYKLYVAENANAFRKYGGRFLTRGGQYEAPEGKPRSRAVVIEFPTYQAALDCYRSPEYAKAMALRQGKALMDLSIVEAYEGPQPTEG